MALAQLEDVHIGGLQQLLGLPITTNCKMVYAEFGQLP